MDQKQPNFPEYVLPEYLSKLGVDFRIIERDTYSIVKEIVPEGKTTCAICSRLRRGILYNAAVEMGCTKIALGHHADDILETFLLNLFFSGSLEVPQVRNSMLRALGNISPSQLMDRGLFDFSSLAAGKVSLADELDAAIGVADMPGPTLVPVTLNTAI